MQGSTRQRLRRMASIAIPAAVTLYLIGLIDETMDPSPLRFFVMLAAVIQGVTLYWRRTHPVPVMGIALAGGLAVHLAAPEGIFPIAALVALGSLAANRPLGISVLGLAATLGLTALNFVTAPTDDALFAMAFPVIVWALGEAVRNRRAAIAEAARRAVGDERARIARELHDVIAHSVSVIVVQAAAADDVFDDHPDQARAALRSIESAGRDALGELRRLLAAVRPGPDVDPSPPQPGLDRLDELVAPLRSAGLDVAVHRKDDRADPLPAGVALSAYRIVQEALTNTLRHADARRAEVTLLATPDLLEVDVVDDGHAATTPAINGSGRGIDGMRERATMLGGTLDAGPRPEGGFRVHARLPIEASP